LPLATLQTNKQKNSMPPCCFHTETIQQNCLHAKPQNKSNCLPHQTHTNKSNKLCTNLTSLSHLNHIAKPPPHQTLNPKFSAFSLNPNFIAFFLNPKLNHFQMRRTLCEHMNTKTYFKKSSLMWTLSIKKLLALLPPVWNCHSCVQFQQPKNQCEDLISPCGISSRAQQTPWVEKETSQEVW
jgi:hypothetical protein